MLDILRLVLALVGQGGRIQHADQLTERLSVPVVRGGAGQQQGVRLGEPLRQLVPEAAFPDQVVRLVDDDRVPVHVVEVVPVRAPLSVSIEMMIRL